MPMKLILSLSIAAIAWSSACPGQDNKADKQPKIIVAVPLAITPGIPVKLSLRGLFLDEVTDIKIVGTEIKVDIASKGKAMVPQNYEATRVGDTQAEIKLSLPAETPSGSVSLVATTAAGMSVAYAVSVAKAEDLIEEKEPNDGFKTAQRITVGKTVVGTIHDPRNVDVFEVKGQAGQKLAIRIVASQAGSLLDPFLTLYDASGQVIAGNDDADGRDSVLEAVLPKDGSYFVSVQDANDAGGPHFAYLLKIAP
jgi:hypothetical protein